MEQDLYQTKAIIVKRSTEELTFYKFYTNSSNLESSTSFSNTQTVTFLKGLPSKPFKCQMNQSEKIEEIHPEELLPKKIGEFPEISLSLNYLEFCCSCYLSNQSGPKSCCPHDCSNISLIPEHSVQINKEGFRPINGPEGGSFYTFSAYIDYRETHMPKNIRIMSAKTPHSMHSGEPPTSCHLWTLNYIYENASDNVLSKRTILKLLASVPAQVIRLVYEEPRYIFNFK